MRSQWLSGLGIWETELYSVTTGLALRGMILEAVSASYLLFKPVLSYLFLILFEHICRFVTVQHQQI
jgi:hypothetical protein